MINTGELPELGFIRGNNFSYSFSMFTKDAEGENAPFDLGAITEIRMDIRNKPSMEGDLIVRLSLGNGIITGGDDGNNVSFSLTKEQTMLFAPNVSPFTASVVIKGTSTSGTVNGKYYTDIAFFVGDEVKTLLKAKISVIANITDTSDISLL